MNRYWAAFKENVNLVVFSTALLISAATTDVRPLLFGAALETLYLAFVPNSNWYRARLQERVDEGENARRETMQRRYLAQLSPIMQARWIRLKNARDAVAQKIADDPQWFRPIVEKLDALLEKWLEFGAREQEIRQSLEQAHAMLSDSATEGTAPATNNQIAQIVARIRNGYAREIEQVEAVLAGENDFGRQQILQNRREVLQRRSAWANRSAEMREVLAQQLELLDDTLGLVQDQLRARAPERVLADLKSVWQRTQNATEQLQELSALEAEALSRNPVGESLNEGVIPDAHRGEKWAWR